MAKLTAQDLLAAGLNEEQIKALVAMGKVKAARGVVARLVKYTAKGSGETSVYLRLAKDDGEWGASLVKLNPGETLTDAGRAALTRLANSIGDMVDNASPEIIRHGKV